MNNKNTPFQHTHRYERNTLQIVQITCPSRQGAGYSKVQQSRKATLPGEDGTTQSSRWKPTEGKGIELQGASCANINTEQEAKGEEQSRMELNQRTSFFLFDSLI